MSQHSIIPALMQLAVQLPVLLVYMAGIVLALAFWGRCRGPSVMTLIACLLMLVTSIGHSILFQFLVQMRNEMGWSGEQFGRTMSLVSIVGSLLHAVGLGLLVAAVFTARKPASTT